MMARSIFTTGERTFTRAYTVYSSSIYMSCVATLEFKNGNFSTVSHPKTYSICFLNECLIIIKNHNIDVEKLDLRNIN